MFRPVFTAILATWIASASASTNPPAAPKAMTPTGANAKATRMKLQPGTEPVKLSTVRGTEPVINSTSLNAAAIDEAGPDDSGWHPYGTLLATLALMCVIAIRRHKTERS